MPASGTINVSRSAGVHFSPDAASCRATSTLIIGDSSCCPYHTPRRLQLLAPCMSMVPGGILFSAILSSDDDGCKTGRTMEKLTPAIRAFLEEKRFAVLASVAVGVAPQQTVMWYLLEDDYVLMN